MRMKGGPKEIWWDQLQKIAVEVRRGYEVNVEDDGEGTHTSSSISHHIRYFFHALQNDPCNGNAEKMNVAWLHERKTKCTQEFINYSYDLIASLDLETETSTHIETKHL